MGRLALALQQHARDNEVTFSEKTPFGIRYVIEGRVIRLISAREAEGIFPTKLENPQGINSLKYSKAKSQITGNRFPQLGWESTKSGCGIKAGAIGALCGEV